jgi:hypothetical protein
MKVKGSQVGWGFWLQWLLASTVGWFVGFIISWLLAAIILGEDNGINVLKLILGYFMGGAALGSVVGLMQWLVLRRQVSRAGWWVLASAAGFAVVGGGGYGAADVVFDYLIGWGGVSSLTNILGRTVVVALGGAVAGILQWLVLQSQVSRAGWWVLASTVGWGLCMAMAFSGLSLLESDIETFIPTLLLLVGGGVVLGAVTGGALVWLLRQPVPEA